jgi:hypothetical protein
MSRAQQGQIESTETANTATETAAANASQAAEQADIGTQQSQLAKFAANNPYVQGGQAQTVENQQLSGTADATAAGAAAKTQQQAQRTGQNASAGVAAGEAEAAQAQRTMGTQEAGATQSRLASGAQYGQDVLSGGNQIVAEQNSLGSQEANEAQGQASVGEQAAQTPSFLDELGQGLITGGGQAITAFCPAKGTLYLMADGNHRAVESLVVGDEIEGIDGESQVIEEIQTAKSRVIRVEVSGGYVIRCSPVHAFALPKGGFTVASRSLFKTISTSSGAATVVHIDQDGEDTVYNVITDGSHTYMAEGLWSLGVGDAERLVSMERWGQIGERLVGAGS